MGIDLASAQAAIGVRAQGLGGAFVGVADDASAVYWNPSGLATGAFVSFLADYSRLGKGSEAGDHRQSSGFIGFSMPALGLAYYRTPAYGEVAEKAAVSVGPGRQDVRRSVPVATSIMAVTLLQSLGDHLNTGGTLKLIRGKGETRGDVDVSAMAHTGRVRLGVVVHNLTAPSFGLDEAGAEAVELQRHARVGVGWGSGWPGNTRVVVAFDADLTARATGSGDRRDIAGGIEAWSRTQRIGLRAGLRRSTIGDTRGAITGGFSAAVRAGTFAEAYVALGGVNEQSWSVGLRIAF